MSVKTEPTPKSAVMSPSAGQLNGLLQRKCACGGSAGLSGQCAECQKKQVNGKPLQTKLAISEPGDMYEQEADRVADEVLATSLDRVMSRTPLRIQRYTEQINGWITTVPDSIDHVLSSSGQPLESEVLHNMNQRFGYDFSHVRVHSGREADNSARDVNAHAYTVGHNIVFADGRFAPGTHEGRRLIAHELAHVVQQSDTNMIDRSENGESSRIPSIQPTYSQRLQRFSVTTEPAGGCGICYQVMFPEPGQAPKEVGKVAHRIVQAAFLGALSLSGSKFVEFPFRAPGDENGRLDLAIKTPSGFQIGEIKPATPSGEEKGVEDLRWYATKVAAAYPNFDVEPLEKRITVGTGLPMLDPLAAASGCIVQGLGVVMMRPGVFGYFCEPRFSVARRTCDCRPKEEDERKSDENQKPVPVSPPLSVPNPQAKGQPKAQPGNKPQSEPAKDPQTVNEPGKKPGWKPEVISGGKGKQDDKQAGPSAQPDQTPIAARSGMGVVLYTLELGGQVLKNLASAEALTALANFMEVVRRRVERLEGEHRMLIRNRDEGSVTGFVGYWSDRLHKVDMPSPEMWNQAYNELAGVRLAIKTGDVAKAVEFLKKADDAYLSCLRTYIEYKEGSIAAAERAKVEIPVIAVALVATIAIAPSAITGLGSLAPEAGSLSPALIE